MLIPTNLTLVMILKATVCLVGDGVYHTFDDKASLMSVSSILHAVYHFVHCKQIIERGV